MMMFTRERARHTRARCYYERYAYLLRRCRLICHADDAADAATSPFFATVSLRWRDVITHIGLLMMMLSACSEGRYAIIDAVVIITLLPCCYASVIIVDMLPMPPELLPMLPSVGYAAILRHYTRHTLRRHIQDMPFMRCCHIRHGHARHADIDATLTPLLRCLPATIAFSPFRHASLR